MGRIRVGPARVPRARAPSRRSSSCSSGATTPARSTSRAASGWTIRGRSGSASSPASTTSRSRCTRRSSAGSGISRPAGASGRRRSVHSTAAPASPAACGAEVVVFHPGFLLGPQPRGRDRRGRRTARDRARAPRREGSRGAVRHRGDGSRARPRLARRLRRDQPPRRLGAPCDRLRAHARDERRRVRGGRTPFADALALVDEVLAPEAPFHIHFSDIAYANRNETKHLPYGEGTLRADPLREALAGFERPATVVSESPDESSSQMIRAALSG